LSDTDTTIQAACIQMCSGEHVADNLEKAATLLQQAVKQQARLVLLPETFACVTQNTEKRRIATDMMPQIVSWLQDQARVHQIWLIGGSILALSDQHEKLHNRSLMISPNGEIIARYNKMHLFDIDLAKESWHESAHVQAGEKPVSIDIETGWKLRLSICYDLRFPELYRTYSANACNILSIPAAFIVSTGKAHWQALLQARAIENQCYVLAAGQSGTHEDGRNTWGHSMIIDAWGNILQQLDAGEGVITAPLSLANLNRVRQHLPALQHRRLL